MVYIIQNPCTGAPSNASKVHMAFFGLCPVMYRKGFGGHRLSQKGGSAYLHLTLSTGLPLNSNGEAGTGFSGSYQPQNQKRDLRMKK